MEYVGYLCSERIVCYAVGKYCTTYRVRSTGYLCRSLRSHGATTSPLATKATVPHSSALSGTGTGVGESKRGWVVDSFTHPTVTYVAEATAVSGQLAGN